MKTRFFFILLLIGSFSCQSDPDNNIKKEEIKSILSDYYNAMTRKDIQKMNELTTLDFVFFREGSEYNNKSVVESAGATVSLPIQFKFDSLNIHFGKTDASAYYFRTASFPINDSVYASLQFLESSTFEKQDGKWKLRFLHSSKRVSAKANSTY